MDNLKFAKAWLYEAKKLDYGDRIFLEADDSVLRAERFNAFKKALKELEKISPKEASGIHISIETRGRRFYICLEKVINPTDVGIKVTFQGKQEKVRLEEDALLPQKRRLPAEEK